MPVSSGLRVKDRKRGHSTFSFGFEDVVSVDGLLRYRKRLIVDLILKHLPATVATIDDVLADSSNRGPCSS
jgi:hypothetical protein